MSGPEHDPDQALGERMLDLLVFAPAGAVVSLVEELPKLAERGRERLGVRISSARAVGEFVVTAGGQELKRRSTRLVGGRGPGPSSPPATSTPPGPASAGAGGSPPVPSPPLAARPSPTGPTPAAPAPASPTTAAPTIGSPTTVAPATADDHVPPVDSLAIPGFDSLSASQVVQRLDGLTRQELVAVRAYELATRGRRTILSRVDQLLEARA